jgi:hypothetical protein
MLRGIQFHDLNACQCLLLTRGTIAAISAALLRRT